MRVFSLTCFECGASFELRTEQLEYTPATCSFCGGMLQEFPALRTLAHAGEDPAQAEPATDELVLVHGPSPGGPSFASASIPPAAGGELSLRLADVVDQGIPSIVREYRRKAALVNLHDLERWVRGAEMVVRAERHRSPDLWVLTLDALHAAAHADRFDDAVTQLAAIVRRQVRSILEDPMSDAARRDLAFRLWAADVDGRLEDLLNDAAVLSEDPAHEPPDE